MKDFLNNPNNPMDTQAFRDLRYCVAPEIAKRLGGPVPKGTNMTPEELQAFAECENYAQFRATADAIKLRRGYEYPPDWWSKMINSGLHAAIMNRIDNASDTTFPDQVRKLLGPLLGRSL